MTKKIDSSDDKNVIPYSEGVVKKSAILAFIDSFKQKIKEFLFGSTIDGDAHNIPDQWRIGKDKWQDFSQKHLKNADLTDIRSHQFGELAAILLGEKPACFCNILTERLQIILKDFGLVTIGPFTYDPKQVEELIAKYPEEFSQIHPTNAKNVMDFLSNSDVKDESMKRGLILGMPYFAVNNFCTLTTPGLNHVIERLIELIPPESEEWDFFEVNYCTEKRHGNNKLAAFFKEQMFKYQDKLGLSENDIVYLINKELPISINWKSYGFGGFCWTDVPGSLESIELEKRLKQAFEYLNGHNDSSNPGHDHNLKVQH